MTEQEKQEIILAVLGGLKVHSMTIGQLTESTTVGDSDYIELNGGRKISFKKFSELVLGQIAENIRMKANLNTQNALATGEEQRLVIRIIEKSERPVILIQGVYYNENSQLIETYALRDMHGYPVLRMVLSEEPSKNVVYCDEDTNTLLRWDGSEMVKVGGGTTDVYTKAESDVLLAEKADDKVTFYDLTHQEQKEGTVAEGVLTNSFSVFALANYIEQIVEQVAGKADKATLNSYAKLSDVNQNIQAGVIGANQSLNTPFLNLGGADIETVDGKLQVDGEEVAMVSDFELLAHVVSDSTKGRFVELIPSCKGYKEIIIRREAPAAISQNVYIRMGKDGTKNSIAFCILNSTRRFIWHIKFDPTITITEQYKYNYQDTLRCDTSVGVCTAFDITNFDLPLCVDFYNTTAQPDGEDYYVYGKK